MTRNLAESNVDARLLGRCIFLAATAACITVFIVGDIAGDALIVTNILASPAGDSSAVWNLTSFEIRALF